MNYELVYGLRPMITILAFMNPKSPFLMRGEKSLIARISVKPRLDRSELKEAGP